MSSTRQRPKFVSRLISIASRALSPANLGPSAMMAIRAASALAVVTVIEFHGILPGNRLHEDIDIFCGGGAVVHVIGVLVHVEHHRRAAAGERRGVIGGPLIDQ